MTFRRLPMLNVGRLFEPTCRVEHPTYLPIAAFILIFFVHCIRATAATTLLSRIETQGSAQAAVFSGTNLFIAEANQGLGIYSIRDPQKPQFQKRIPTSSAAIDLAISGQFVFAACGSQGLIATPLDGSGNLTSTTSIGGDASHITSLDAGLAVSRLEGGIALLSVSGSTLKMQSLILPETRFQSLSSKGNLLLAISAAGDVMLIDAADINRPAVRWTRRYASPVLNCALSNAGAIFALGRDGWLYADSISPDAPPSPQSFSESAYCAGFLNGSMCIGSATVQFFDSLSTQPRNLGNIDPLGAVMKMAIDKDHLAVVSGVDGVSLYQVDPAGLPRPMLRWGDGNFAQSIAATEAHIAIGDANRGLLVLDRIGQQQVDLRGYNNNVHPIDMAFRGSMLLASDPAKGLVSLSLQSTGAIPYWSTLFNRSGSAFGFDIMPDDQTVVVAAQDYGLKTIDVDSMKMLGIGPLEWINARDVALIGNTALVAGESSGLSVYALDDPTSPQLIIKLPIGRGKAIALNREKTRAYLSSGEEGFYALDVSNPRAPQILGHIEMWNALDAALLTDRFAIVAQGANGLALIDVANPAAPKLLFEYSPYPGELAQSIDLVGTTAFVAYGKAGMVQIDFAPLLQSETRARYWNLYQ